MLSRHSFSHNFPSCTYTYLLSLLRFRSAWTLVTATETQTNRQGIFSYFFRMSTYFYATITKTANLINILVNITEDNIDWNIFSSKTKRKILTFSTRRQIGWNDVLDEGRTAGRWVASSRAHAWLCKFTSCSRPSTSRPGILRSLM